MRAGRLDRRVTFQSPNPTRGTDGSLIEGWTTQVTLSAALEAAGGRETFDSGRLSTEITHRIIVRFRQDIKATWRAVMSDGASPASDRLFRILAVQNPDDGRRELHIMVKEMPDGEPA